MVWIVYSTSLCPPGLLVQNTKTLECGIITDFKKNEWNKAFYAPKYLYEWDDVDRITSDKEDESK